MFTVSRVGLIIITEKKPWAVVRRRSPGSPTLRSDVPDQDEP